MLWKAILLGAILLATTAQGQTPPISTASVPADTIRTTEVPITITVESDIGWDQGGGVGLYWTSDPMAGWNYISGDPYLTSRTWTPPAEDLTYSLATSVIDNAGNDEGHEFVPEATFYYCPTCPAPEPPPDDILDHVRALAEAGIKSWGTPRVQYYWTRPVDGSPVDHYIGVLQIAPAVGDTATATIDSIPRGDDPTYDFYELSYQYEASMRFRVSGVDAQGRVGPSSLWSAWWKDDGPPGQPGEIRQTLIFD